MVELLAPYVETARLQRMRAVLARRTRRLTAVLDRFYDPNNVAACARTADALGLQDIHVIRAPSTSPLGLRASSRAVSLASERWLTRHLHAGPAAALQALRACGHRIAATTLDPARPATIDSLPLDRPLAVVFGAEREGAHRELLDAADFHVALEMRGFSQSLNVSVAMGIVMHRLRERLEAEVPPDAWRLAQDDVEDLLARWLRDHVPHAARILAELARRGR